MRSSHPKRAEPLVLTRYGATRNKCSSPQDKGCGTTWWHAVSAVSHLALLHAVACACCLAGWSGRFASPPLQTGAGPGFPRSAAPGGLEAIAILKQASLRVSLPIVQAVSRLQPPASPPGGRHLRYPQWAVPTKFKAQAAFLESLHKRIPPLIFPGAPKNDTIRGKEKHSARI